MHSDLPKVLQPLAGKPLLAHVLDRARSLGPAAIHVVFGHGGGRVREAFGDQDLSWALQAEQLGTGHAVGRALPEVPDDHTVLILCGDVPLVGDDTLRRLLTAVGGERALALISARLADPRGYGRVVRNPRGEVTGIVEEQDASDAERAIDEINSGLMCAPAADLKRWLAQLTNNNAQREYYLTDVIALAVADRVPVRAVIAQDASDMLGINDRAQLAAAERTLQRRIAAGLMERGVTIADPGRIDVRGQLDTGRDVFIDVGTVFEGHVTLGDQARIGAYAVIRNARIGAGTVVHPHTVIDGAETGERCELGPFARLRPGAVLANTVKIGNFVEVKKSRIDDGSKINHLTYIGDATIGRQVNVGAGTITCNYDGAFKHETRIGDGAFIGSGVMLVAPVAVGEQATIGAGSTITRDAEPGVLTLARVRQTTVTGWKKPVKPTT
jgi:bifunctional UDP-N-acetylglucosamine pyrophosphorylase / glucosamine-1-phosphate N-acetyltransferase